MNKEVALVTNSVSPKNLPFIVVSLGHIPFLLEDKVEKLGFHPCHMLGAPTIQVPHMLIFYQGILHKTKSSTKIWSPYKFGSCTGTGRGWDPPGCLMPSQPGRGTERPRLLETWPRDREAETFGDLAERPRPLKT